MKRIAHHNPAQLGFDSLLAAADEDNERRVFLKATSHLPDSWEDAVPFYRSLLDQYDAAMLQADEEEAFRLRGDAHDLAVKLNGGVSLGICAEDGYGTRLQAETAAGAGDMPKWGQAGSFALDHDGMAVRIEIDGLFGIGGTGEFWPGFSAHAVDRRKPFLSETGYRSFLGCGYSGLIAGMTPGQFVGYVLSDFIDNQLGGELVKVKTQRQKAAA